MPVTFANEPKSSRIVHLAAAVAFDAFSSNSSIPPVHRGGLCIEIADCLSRAKGDLGSSKNWGATFTDDNNVLASADFNPFATFNRVYLPWVACAWTDYEILERIFTSHWS